MTRPRTALGVVVGLAAVTVGLAEATHSSTQESVGDTAPRPTAVVSSRLVCPDVVGRQVGEVTRTTTYGVGVPPAAPAGAASGGAVQVTSLRAGVPPTTEQVADERGTATLHAAEGIEGDAVLSARAGLAPGLAADEVGRRDAGAYRGIEGLQCAPPRAEAWFLGATSVVGAHAELRLTNIDSQPATVDVVFHGRRGPVQAPDSRGVTVPPRSTLRLRLERVAPNQQPMLVHVQAQSGRVAAMLRQQTQRAATPKGVDWIPAAAGPATTSVVPGIVAGEGPRELLLGNPGETDATAELQLVFSDGAFVPRGLANVTVRAGSAVSVPAAELLDGRAAALVVRADQPLVSGAWMSTGPRVAGYAEQAWSAATPPLSGPATAVVNPVRGASSVLLLTAPEAAGEATVVTLAGAGVEGGAERTVDIPAGRTVGVRLADLASGASNVAVTVTPATGSGPVHVARQLVEAGTRSPLFTVLPMRSAREFVLLRPAGADPRAARP